MRRKVTRIAAPKGLLVDTCGTGGDKSRSFNVSTAAAFVEDTGTQDHKAPSRRCSSWDVIFIENMAGSSRTASMASRTSGLAP